MQNEDYQMKVSMHQAKLHKHYKMFQTQQDDHDDAMHAKDQELR